MGNNDYKTVSLLLFPASVILLFVVLFPIIMTVIQSFTKSGEMGFTLNNYKMLFMDMQFRHYLLNSILFVSFSVFFDLIVGFGVALLLNQPIKSRNFFRVLLLLPWMIPPVVAATTWKWMYNPTAGIINTVLLKIGLIDKPILWLSSKELVMGSIIFANIWRGFPFVMIIMLAGLQTIPESLYEAASIDGATGWQNFIYITLPNLRKNIIIVLALVTIWETRQIDLVITMTRGGPGTLTDVLVTGIYKQYFQFFQFNYASAMSILMSFFVFLISIPYIRGILKD